MYYFSSKIIKPIKCSIHRNSNSNRPPQFNFDQQRQQQFQQFQQAQQAQQFHHMMQQHQQMMGGPQMSKFHVKIID